MKKSNLGPKVLALIFIIMPILCDGTHPNKHEVLFRENLKVNVYTYQLKKSQTDKHNLIGAFGDRLRYNNRSVAISRDLKKYFQKNDTIYLLLNNKKHIFVVRDIMNSRHKNSIDILSKKNLKTKGEILLNEKYTGRSSGSDSKGGGR